MSPGNQGVFWLVNEVAFWRILGFCSLRKCGHSRVIYRPFVGDVKAFLRKYVLYDTSQGEFVALMAYMWMLCSFCEKMILSYPIATKKTNKRIMFLMLSVFNSYGMIPPLSPRTPT